MADLRRQRRRYKARKVEFMRTPAPLELPEGAYGTVIVSGPSPWQPILSAGADAVYLTGPGWSLPQLRAVLEMPLGRGWRHGAHYLTLPHPVLHFEHESGRRLEVHRAAAYFGEGTYSPETARAAWLLLGAAIRGAFDEGELLATPATTGRYLLMRSIPFGRSWPQLEPETADFLRATSGQARVQMFGRFGHTSRIEEWDGRLMYGALCDNLPAGEPERDTIDCFANYREGRYLVSFTVPRDWDQRHPGIGIFPVRGESGWEWPAHPGQRATSWADSREVRCALQMDWKMTIRERLLYPAPPYAGIERRNGQISRRGPLDAWAHKLSNLRVKVPRDELSGQLVANAVRAILLFGLGSLHGTPRRRTHIVSTADAQGGAIPSAARDVLPLGPDLMVWTDTEPPAWSEMIHPEWTTTVWGRARAAMLSSSTGRERPRAGLLHYPAPLILGAFTDAIWVAAHDPSGASPSWYDDGKPGRFRRVWASSDGWHEIPTTAAGLRAMRAE